MDTDAVQRLVFLFDEADFGSKFELEFGGRKAALSFGAVGANDQDNRQAVRSAIEAQLNDESWLGAGSVDVIFNEAASSAGWAFDLRFKGDAVKGKPQPKLRVKPEDRSSGLVARVTTLREGGGPYTAEDQRVRIDEALAKLLGRESFSVGIDDVDGKVNYVVTFAGNLAGKAVGALEAEVTKGTEDAQVKTETLAAGRDPEGPTFEFSIPGKETFRLAVTVNGVIFETADIMKDAALVEIKAALQAAKQVGGGQNLGEFGFDITVTQGKRDNDRSVRFDKGSDRTKVEELGIAGTGAVADAAGAADKGGAAVGALVVRNDIRSSAKARIVNTTLVAGGANVLAREAALITANLDAVAKALGAEGDQSLAVGGIIATNLIRNQTEAVIDRSNLVLTGDLSVIAENSAEILARNASSISSDGTGVNFTLAFNTDGYESQNVLFALIDALVGTDIGTESPATARAEIRNSFVSAAGTVEVRAESVARILAEVTNATSSVLSDEAKDDASATAVGFVLASNMVSSAANAGVINTEDLVKNSLFAGAVRIDARDESSILSRANLSAESGAEGELASAIRAFGSFFAQTYSDYSGERLIHLGDRVRIGTNGYSIFDRPAVLRHGDRVTIDWNIAGGIAGTTYEYVGENDLTQVRLDRQNFSDTTLWKAVSGTAGKIYVFKGLESERINLRTEDFTNDARWWEVDLDELVELAAIAGDAIEGSDAKGSAFGGLVVRNDLRSEVLATIKDVAVTADGP